MTPVELVLGILGNGPATELALVGRLVGRGVPYDEAVRQVKDALVVHLLAKRIEQLPGIAAYRLSSTYCEMEPTTTTTAAKGRTSEHQTP